MKRSRFRMRKNIYSILWIVILGASVYLLVRYAALSFLGHIGQADSLKERAAIHIFSNVLESGSHIIRYTANNEETYPFPVSLLADEFAVHEFLIDHTPKAVYSNQMDFSFYINSETKLENEKEAKTSDTKKKQVIGYHHINNSFLTMEYILTNGAVFHNLEEAENNSLYLVKKINQQNQLEVGFLEGDIHKQENDYSNDALVRETMTLSDGTLFTLDQLKDIDFLIRNFYIVDGTTRVTDSLFDAEKLLSMDMTLKQDEEAPQILIYHTHSQEAYIDSRKNKIEDSVVGVGAYLASILKEQYGYNVIHDPSTYDLINGVEDRNKAYNYALDGIEKILKENPTIEVVIDIHRDDGKARVTTIDGKESARIMLFNGLSRDSKGPITHLDNPNLQDNLAFSLQLQLKSLEKYPGLFYKNYLKCYRYNLHVRPKSILVELGTDENTLKSAKNAMIYFAEVLDAVLKGK